MRGRLKRRDRERFSECVRHTKKEKDKKIKTDLENKDKTHERDEREIAKIRTKGTRSEGVSMRERERERPLERGLYYPVCESVRAELL